MEKQVNQIVVSTGQIYQVMEIDLGREHFDGFESFTSIHISLPGGASLAINWNAITKLTRTNNGLEVEFVDDSVSSSPKRVKMIGEADSLDRYDLSGTCAGRPFTIPFRNVDEVVMEVDRARGYRQKDDNPVPNQNSVPEDEILF